MFRVVVEFTLLSLTLCTVSLAVHLGPEHCLKTDHHLASPIRNVELLHELCAPWSSKSCCTPQTALEAHSRMNHLSFDMNHCGADAISDECHREFVREMCYYSCDPYIVPWIVRPDHAFRKERLMQVPMCQRDCNRWWNACKESRTCVRNWRKHFYLDFEPELNDTVNKCPEMSECKQIQDIYFNANDFCETVWDHSWQVMSDLDKCVQLDFPPNAPNPNEQVEQFYLQHHPLDKKLSEFRNSPLWTLLLWATGFAFVVYILGNCIYYLIVNLLCRICC